MPTSRHVVYRTLSQVWFKYQMFGGTGVQAYKEVAAGGG